MVDLPRRAIDAGLRAARLYWRTVHPFRVGVQGLILDDEGRVLLVHHGYGRQEWHFPGGGVKRQETAIEGLHREVTEETGLTITAPAEQLDLLGVYANFREGKSDHTAIFVIRPDQWRGPLTDGGIEVIRSQFVPLDALPEGTSPGTRRRLLEFTGKTDITYEW